VKPSFVIVSLGFRSEKGNKNSFAPFAPWRFKMFRALAVQNSKLKIIN
jgi:hypothetical protein